MPKALVRSTFPNHLFLAPGSRLARESNPLPNRSEILCFEPSLHCRCRSRSFHSSLVDGGDESGIMDSAVGPVLVEDIDNEPVSLSGKYFGLEKQLRLFWDMSVPFFKEDDSSKWLLGGVVALTLLNSGVSVAFSYIGRDFWTALSNKDPEQFNIMLQRFLGALAAGVPVTVFYRYQREKLALAWREWMTNRVMQVGMKGIADAFVVGLQP
ncbi:unnamed protein product [Choristocarpus tenellus]